MFNVRRNVYNYIIENEPENKTVADLIERTVREEFIKQEERKRRFIFNYCKENIKLEDLKKAFKTYEKFDEFITELEYKISLNEEFRRL